MTTSQAERGSIMQHTAVAIIGAGQAGLAVSNLLTEASVSHVVLERGRTAERWRSRRWDSLRMLTPNWMSRLPGWSYRGSEPGGFMRAAEVASYLAEYAASFGAPIVTGADVRSVRAADGGYLVVSDAGSWRADAVVIATGYCDLPAVPRMARELDRSVGQLTPDRYRNPDSVPDGGVLVVGASATGVQLADELAGAGRDVWLAVGRHNRVPRRYRGMDIMWWLDSMGSLDRRTAVTDPARLAEPSPQLVGGPRAREVDLPTLADRGVRLAGRVSGVEDSTAILLADDLRPTTAEADARQWRLLDRIDRFAAAAGLDAELDPPIRPVTSVPPRNSYRPSRLDLRATGIGTVLWATGYRREYPWLELAILDTAGEIRRRGGSQPTLAATLALPPSLTDRQAEALAGAAVLGSTFDTDEFLHVSGLAEDEAYAVLDSGVSLRLLVRTRFGYEFRHALLRDALLDWLRPGRLRERHEQAAASLEALDRPPARIGYHLIQAGQRAAAVLWLLRAAETSAALGAYQEALASLESIRADAKDADLKRLLSLRAELLMARADAGAVDAYREALGHTTDPSEQVALRVRLARAATFADDLETATIALDGLVPNGSPSDVELLLAQGSLAVFRRDIAAAAKAAAQARRQFTLGWPDKWQSFELISLQGMVAHNRGEWFQRLRSELRSSARKPALAAGIFDSHLCVAEFLLYGPTPYDEVLDLAASLRETAERSGALRAVAFATALRGEAALLKGDLALANAELADAVDLHRDIGSAAGEAHSLQRLAEVRLALGERDEANQLLHRALPLARFSSIASHLVQRVYGTMILAAPDPVTARAAVDHAESALGTDDRCAFCDIMLAIPAALACAASGDLDDARRHLRTAENSAQMWEGTAWHASILEAQAHLASAGGDPDAAVRLLRSAAELVAASGQPLDAERCRLAQVPAR